MIAIITIKRALKISLRRKALYKDIRNHQILKLKNIEFFFTPSYIAKQIIFFFLIQDRFYG